MDPYYRQCYKSLFRQFGISYTCENPLHATLFDCLRHFTSPTEIEGVSCEGCGVLNALLDPALNKQETEDAEALREKLQHSLHRVRSSHDIEADLKETAGVKEARGVFQKYELVGRPPRCLLICMERKMLALQRGGAISRSMNPFLSKQDDFVEFPLEFDLREFCLFTQVCEGGGVHRSPFPRSTWRAC